MEDIDRLVTNAGFRETLQDVVSEFGGQLETLSPEAKRKIKKMLFAGEPPDDRSDREFLDAWEVVKNC